MRPSVLHKPSQRRLPDGQLITDEIWLNDDMISLKMPEVLLCQEQLFWSESYADR